MYVEDIIKLNFNVLSLSSMFGKTLYMGYEKLMCSFVEYKKKKNIFFFFFLALLLHTTNVCKNVPKF